MRSSIRFSFDEILAVKGTCSYCGRSMRALELVESPVFGAGWFSGDSRGMHVRPAVPSCAACAHAFADVDARLHATWNNPHVTSPVAATDVRRWLERLVRGLYRFELATPLPPRAQIHCIQLEDDHGTAALDCTLDFQYRLVTSGLAYWFASPSNRNGGSVWFVSIRRRVCLFAAVAPR